MRVQAALALGAFFALCGFLAVTADAIRKNITGEDLEAWHRFTSFIPITPYPNLNGVLFVIAVSIGIIALMYLIYGVFLTPAAVYRIIRGQSRPRYGNTEDDLAEHAERIWGAAITIILLGVTAAIAWNWLFSQQK